MTEKDYNPEQRNKKTMEKQKKVDEAPKGKAVEKKKPEEKTEKKNVKQEGKTKKKEEPKKPKKSEAVVNGRNLGISTLHSIAICRFIKGKKIGNAIRDLQQVLLHKKSIPMKGEIPHRKGKIMSGRFPKNAVEQFIKLLRSLVGNANYVDINEPVIVEAVANMASRPYGRFGRVKKKRTHVKIKVKDKRGGKK